MRKVMEFRDLADDTAKKAWEKFRALENEWRNDPTNNEKYHASREAFQEYDRVRIKMIKLPNG